MTDVNDAQQQKPNFKVVYSSDPYYFPDPDDPDCPDMIIHISKSSNSDKE